MRSTVVAILLAAGESTRMGRSKPLLAWAGMTLIEYQIGELRAAGADPVIAVLGHRAGEVRPYALRVGAQVAINEHYREGRAGSVRTGAAAVALPPESILVLNVDQPRDRAISAALLRQQRDHRSLITVPAYQGRRGHPLLLAGSLLDELRAVDETSEGLRGLIRRHVATRLEIPFDDPSVLLDLNHPEEYEAARLQQG